MMTTSVMVCADGEAIAVRAQDLMITQLGDAIERRGGAHLALTGGSTASTLYRVLRSDERSRRVDWHKVHIWQGDERFVPLSHDDSNWAVAKREWLDHPDGPRIPAGHRHPFPVEEAISQGKDAAWAAETYAAQIEATLPQRDSVPAFDVFLLGVGGDGHILSTFPGTAAVHEEHRLALAVEAPSHIEPALPRVTLAPFLLRAAGLIVVMATGAGKAVVLSDCFGDVVDPDRWPAQLAIRPNAVWLLEPDCAAGL